MSMTMATLWWLACGILLAVEMTTGTFYLLMLSLGAAAGAIGAHLDLSLFMQIVAAALVGGCAVTAWHIRCLKRKRLELPLNANPDLSLDIGKTIEVKHWQADGSTRVAYRGSHWDARYTGGDSPQPGPYRIRAIDGSCLLLERSL